MATRTIARLYDVYADATQVVQDLEAAGIPHSDISLIGRDESVDTTVGATPGIASTGPMIAGAPVTAAGYRDPAVDHVDATETDTTETATHAGAGASIGTLIGGGAGLLAGIGALAIPGVGPVVAAGWLVATLAGAGIGAATGGVLGSLTGAGVSEEDAHVYAEGLRRGGTLVTVRVDDTDAPRVEQILNSRTYADPAERRGEYTAGGWSRFDETTPPGTNVPPGAPPVRPL